MATRDSIERQIAAVKAEIQARENALYTQQTGEAPPPTPGGFEQFGSGFGETYAEQYYGAKDLAGELTPEDSAYMAELSSTADAGGYGTAGRIAGELSQYALPGAAAFKGAKALSNSPKLAAALPTGVDALTSALRGLNKLPGEGESRVGNMVQETGASLIGSGIGKGISKAFKGFDITESAQKMFDNGVHLTPGQAARSEGLQGFESLLAYVPTAGKTVKHMRTRAEEQWNREFLQAAARPGTTITDIGPAGMRELKADITAGYSEAWALANNFDPEKLAYMHAFGRMAQQELGGETRDAKIVQRLLEDAERLVAVGGFGQLDELIRAQKKTALKNPNKTDLADVLVEMSDLLRASMPIEAKNALLEMDKIYPKYLVAKKASAAAKQTDGVFDAAQATNAMGAVGKETRTATGTAPLYDETAEARHTVGRELPGVLVNVRKAVSRFFPSLGIPYETMADASIGQTRLQKLLREGAEQVPISARYVAPTPGAFGASLEE